MTSRERIFACLERDGSVDRVPIDFGGYQSGICWLAYDGLKRALGMSQETGILEMNQMLAVVDDGILDRFHIDTRYVFGDSGTPPRWLNDITYEDEWGIHRQRPPSSYYYDMVFHPWAEKSKEEIEKAPLPPVNASRRCAGLRQRVQELRQKTDKAVFSSMSSVFEQTWNLMGMESFLIALASDRNLVEAALDRVLEGFLAINDAIFAEAGEGMDCIQFWEISGFSLGPLWILKYGAGSLSPGRLNY